MTIRHPEDLEDVVVRDERPEDIAAVAEVNERAFGGTEEARIVDAVRRSKESSVSLVATLEDRVVGHILFSPVTVDGGDDPAGVGLAPMAVLPELQRRGIGGLLVEAGLERCRRMATCFVVVVGHPGYYPRFGFFPASRAGLRYEQPVPDEAFMVLELEPGCLDGVTGVIRYLPAFTEHG